MRGRLSVIAALGVTVVTTGPASAAAPGRIGIRLLADPSVASAELLGHAYIADRIAPGARVTRQIEISNSTPSTANISVYAAGATQRQSVFGFAPGRSANELSSWTSVNRHVVRVPSRTKTLDTVTINVPKNASSGERYAVVWAEVSAKASAAGGVRLVNRVGIRMYLSIGPGGAPPSRFVIRSIVATRSTTGSRVLVASIHNSGRRTLELSGTLILSNGPGRLSAGPFPVKLGSALAPTDTRPLTLRLDKRLPRGPWRVQLHLTSGPVAHTAVATLTFPAG